MASQKRLRLFMFGVVIIIVLLVALQRLSTRIDEIFANVSTADCAWNASVQVWDDANRDGMRDASERPLNNVVVYGDDVLNGSSSEANSTSDSDGNASLGVFIAGCPETKFEVFVQAPLGYCSTTPERLSESPYTFGLAQCSPASP